MKRILNKWEKSQNLTLAPDTKAKIEAVLAFFFDELSSVLLVWSFINE